MAETQTSYAKSAFTDPLNIINFIAVALVLPEIRDLVPQEYVRLVAGLTALLNLFVRTFQTTHPVAFIAPMQVVPVEVKSWKRPSRVPRILRSSHLQSRSSRQLWFNRHRFLSYRNRRSLRRSHEVLS